MLDIKVFEQFIKKANIAHQQLCLWFSMNNEFAKHQARWNQLEPGVGLFTLEAFTRKHGCKYKIFFCVIVPTLNQGWILSTARLFDPAYHSRDIKKEKPRISLDYVLGQLSDQALAHSTRLQKVAHDPVIKSLREHRDNTLAHNDATFTTTQIEAGVEKLFNWLENIIAQIKVSEPRLKNCGIINVTYNEKLAQCGVDEVFENLLLAEKVSDPCA